MVILMTFDVVGAPTTRKRPFISGQQETAATLTLFWTNSRSGSAKISGYFLRYAIVSSEVEKLFIRLKRTFFPNFSRIEMTCFAVKSRKVSSPFTRSNDLAESRPMEVPRPPLSLTTTVSSSSDASCLIEALISSRLGTSTAGWMLFSLIMPDSPLAHSMKECLKARMAASERPSSRIFFSLAANLSAAWDCGEASNLVLNALTCFGRWPSLEG